jgi:hypothetical protein
LSVSNALNLWKQQTVLGEQAVNAAEQANSVEKVSKIAAVVNVFRSEFSEASVDLSPWVKSAETEKFDDPDSIDLSFHFPRRSFTCQSQIILMQIRLPSAVEANPQRVLGIELSGHDGTGQQWRFATTGHWEFWGLTPPLPDAKRKLRQVCLQILQLFNLAPENSLTEW